MWMATEKNGYAGWRVFVPTAAAVALGWALLTPLIYRLTRLLLPSRVGWVRSILGHAAALLVVNVVITLLRVRLLAWFERTPFPTTDSLLSLLLFWWDVHLFTYLVIVVMGYAVDGFRRYLDRSLRAHVLQTQLARAHLHYLELQLQPHFLFNSLNAIQELAHEAPGAAERMLHQLRSLLALSLAHRGRDEVSLAEELTSLQWYVDIQRIRFSDWLTVSMTCGEGSSRALVPHLILQPLVENAIRHGLSVRSGPGRIDIATRRSGDRLLLEVRDNGVGMTPRDSDSRPGIGLRNTGDRLRQLYGKDQALRLRDVPGGGTAVEIDIPFREASELSPAPASARSIDVEESMDDVDSWRTGEFSPSNFALLPAQSTSAERAMIQPSSGAVREPKAAGDGEESAIEASATGAPLGARVWLALCAIWLGMAVVWTVQIFLFSRAQGHPMALLDWSSIRLQLTASGYWIAVSPLIVLAARKLRIRPESWPLPLLAHLTLAVALAFGHLEAAKLIYGETSAILVPFNINPLTGNLFIYSGLVAWVNARDFRVWYRARELAAAQLATEIATSRFRALCVQLRPQFLLGTLELLAKLVHLDVWRAEHLIARLADVLRQTLDLARDRTTTLRQEVQLLTSSIEAHRIGIRPDVTLELDIEPDALTTVVPSRLVCTMADDLLASDATESGTPVIITVAAERVQDATRIRLHGDAQWRAQADELHAWWRKKSVTEAVIADAGPLVSVTFPDRSTAVLVIADALTPSGNTAGSLPRAAAAA